MDYEGYADDIRFGENPSVGDDDEWWKDDGREKLANALKKLVEAHNVPIEEAKDILNDVFWAGSAEFGG